jgi:multidrug resistance protein
MAKPRSRATLPTLFSIIIVDLIGFGILMPALPFYAKKYGATPTELGLLLAIHAAMQFVFAPIWGRLSDRIGRRPIMLGTVAGTAVALFALALAPSLAWLFVARALSGIFAANISVATAYLTDVTEPEERTRWMGMVGASFGIGFLLGPAIGGLLAPYGLAVPIFTAAGMATVNFVYAAVVLKEPVRHELATGAGVGRIEVLRNPSVARLTTVNLFFSLAVTQLEAMFAFYMIDRFDFDMRQVAFILVGMAFVMVLIQGGGMRRLAERFGERHLLLVGLLLMSVGIGSVPLSGSVALLMAPLMLAAVGRAIAQPPMMSWVSTLADERERGSVMGTFQSAASLARVLGPVVAGLAYEFSPAWPFWLGGMLLACALVTATTVRAAQPRDQPATTEAR